MGEQSSIERWKDAAGASASTHPYKAMGVSAALALALAQGVPQLYGMWTEQSAADEARLDAAHAAHLRTLGDALESCEAARQRLVEAIRECRTQVSGELEIPESAREATR